MELQAPDMTLSNSGCFCGFMHADQNAFSASKPTFSKTGFDDCAPSAMVNDQEGWAHNGKQ
jgi:hypothetical protein